MLVVGRGHENIARVGRQNILTVRLIRSLVLDNNFGLDRSIHCSTSGDLSSSASHFDTDLDPNRPSFMPGIAHLINCDYVSSIQYLESFLQIEPTNPVGWFWLGLVRANQGKYELAAHAVEAASAEEYVVKLLQRATDQRDLEQAHMWLMVAAKTVETVPYVRAMVFDYLTKGQREKALALWQQFSDNLPQDTWHYWWALGLNASFHGSPEQALSYFEVALQASPKDPRLLDDMLSVLLELKDYGRAREVALQAVEVAQDLAYARFRTAQVYEKLDDYTNAAYWMALARESAPRWWVVYNELGVITCAQKQTDIDMALAYFDQSLELSPDQIYSMMARAKCLHQAGRVAEAFAYAEKTIEKHGDDPRL